MAMETNQSPPVCQHTWHNFYRHRQLCWLCVLQWAQRNPVCPLCRGTVVTIRFSNHGEDDYLETSITAPEELPDGSRQADRAPGSLDENSSLPPVVSPSSSPQGTVSPAEQEGSGLQFVGNILPEVWVEIFRQRQHLLDPVRSWLHERLETMYGDRWWLRESTLCYFMCSLCTWGPDEEKMIQDLQELLGEHTVPLVQGTIGIIMAQCSSGAQRLLRSHAAADEDGSPADSSSSSSSRSLSSCLSMGTPTSSPTVSVEEEEAGTMEAALREGHNYALPMPIPTGGDQPQEDLGQEVVPVTGPSAQGTSCNPSTP